MLAATNSTQQQLQSQTWGSLLVGALSASGSPHLLAASPTRGWCPHLPVMLLFVVANCHEHTYPQKCVVLARPPGQPMHWTRMESSIRSIESPFIQHQISRSSVGSLITSLFFFDWLPAAQLLLPPAARRPAAGRVI